jgi:hypothetical protein
VIGAGNSHPDGVFAPFRPANPIVQTFINMDILTDAEKRGILHDNAARLLRLDN